MDETQMTPPTTDEGLENKLISLAYKHAQKLLEDGSAPSQITTHFLRLGSMRAKVEMEELKLKSKLLAARIETEQGGQKLTEMFQAVMSVLKDYKYSPPGERYDEDLY